MAIFIHNSLTRKKEEFKPLKSPLVNIYTCGVTAYDECHIGHARSLYVFDVIKRYLESRGYKVRFVRNITDIDDKIINRSRELGVGWRNLVKKYIRRYYEDLRFLNIKKADIEPRATENVKDMVRHIKGLIKKGYAYTTDSGVYFSVRKFSAYGKLSGQGIEEMLSGARVESDEKKHDPLDFALWKSSKAGEPYWKSPWGRGRPGWHIECSVMSAKYLKTMTLDIHAGGRDLIFPHHENEIAQAESFTGKPFARYWIHHGLLTINGQKMAKSLGNFISVKEFAERFKDADILKLFFLSTHYSHPVDYSEEKIKEAKKQKKIFDDFIDKVNNWQRTKPADFSDKDKMKTDMICEKFADALDDDFNTPQALAALFELVDLASGFISFDKERGFLYAKSKLEEFLRIFGISIRGKQKIPRAVLRKISERNLARKNKDFKKADMIREELEKKSYLVSDTASSVTLTFADSEKET